MGIRPTGIRDVGMVVGGFDPKGLVADQLSLHSDGARRSFDGIGHDLAGQEGDDAFWIITIPRFEHGGDERAGHGDASGLGVQADAGSTEFACGYALPRAHIVSPIRSIREPAISIMPSQAGDQSAPQDRLHASASSWYERTRSSCAWGMVVMTSSSAPVAAWSALSGPVWPDIDYDRVRYLTTWKRSAGPSPPSSNAGAPSGPDTRRAPCEACWGRPGRPIATWWHDRVNGDRVPS